MSEKEEPVLSKINDLKTPVYIRNATKAYYERKKTDLEFMKKNADNAREWRKQNKAKHNEYQKQWNAKQKELQKEKTEKQDQRFRK
jgi:predicted transcriptional regulator